MHRDEKCRNTLPATFAKCKTTFTFDEPAYVIRCNLHFAVSQQTHNNVPRVHIIQYDVRGCIVDI